MRFTDAARLIRPSYSHVHKLGIHSQLVHKLRPLVIILFAPHCKHTWIPPKKHRDILWLRASWGLHSIREDR
jgi:hypothetical protein